MRSLVIPSGSETRRRSLHARRWPATHAGGEAAPRKALVATPRVFRQSGRRLESNLLDDRVVHDFGGRPRNASRRDRLETEALPRSAYPFRAEFCAPAKGWESSAIRTELEADLPPRHLDAAARSWLPRRRAGGRQIPRP